MNHKPSEVQASNFGTKLPTKPNLMLDNEITRLNAQINEHKSKEIEMFYEKEKLNKTLDHCKKMNQVSFCCYCYKQLKQSHLKLHASLNEMHDYKERFIIYSEHIWAFEDHFTSWESKRLFDLFFMGQLTF